MDIYQVWCDLAPETDAGEFVAALSRYLGQLRQEGRIAGFRLLRRKLGLAPDGFTEFCVHIEVDNLAQLEHAFQRVAGAERDRATDADAAALALLHRGVNQQVRSARFALYRDYPDPPAE